MSKANYFSIFGDRLLKIHREHKNWSSLAIMGFIALVLLLGVYYPLYGRYVEMERELTGKREQIAKIKASGISSLAPDELAKLQGDAIRFEQGFVALSQAPALLDQISDQAEKSRVKVITINSDSPLEVKDENQKPVEMGQEKYLRLPIRMRLEGTYSALGDFFHTLKNSLKWVFVIERFSIKKDMEGVMNLDCQMTLSFFSKQEGGK